MIRSLWSIGLLGLAGCGALPVIEVHSAPALPREEVDRLNVHRNRILAIDAGSVFPRVLDVLMDQGFLILSADGNLGTVAFRKQWRDPAQRDAIINQDGNLLVTALGPMRTRVRLLLSGSSQELAGNYATGQRAMVVSVQQDLGQEEYGKLLDVLERGLVPEVDGTLPGTPGR